VIALATPPPIVSFVGASETAGFGLAQGDPAYPEILARRCSFVAAVDGQVNTRVIFRPLPPGSFARILFVSQFDAVPTPAVEDLAGWLRPNERTIMVEAPLISAARGEDIAYYQRRLYDVLDQVSSTTGAIIILLHQPKHSEEYTQADGLHPNERGQEYIADALEPALQMLHLCKSQSTLQAPRTLSTKGHVAGLNKYRDV
jgi:hypothetical protein